MQPEIKDNIALIRIDHPPANAWNLSTMQAFSRAVEQVKTDAAVRVVVITGAGEKFFSAASMLAMPPTPKPSAISAGTCGGRSIVFPNPRSRPSMDTPWVAGWSWPWPVTFGCWPTIRKLSWG
ncbi:enoyl-CoA hydratase-related protein [Desulfosarcina cetonica]|uniref:enoyl-CoA hydratase-related protein n=1 Tax=Desulfosarcina cetonica TaxID=90730 RepID=UPI00248CE529|nr:enoyl-CoA hydratase-related protein [Desulfosarcina cetonica]